MNNNQNVNISLNPFTEDENRFFGVFVSHSNNKDDLDGLSELVEYSKKENIKIQLVYDREFLEGGDPFKKRILLYTNAYAGIVYITKNSIQSDWVNYEIGILTSRQIPVFIYDPSNLLKEEEFVNDYHIKQYLPAFQNKEDLFQELKKIAVYNNLYIHDNSVLSVDEFNNRLIQNTTNCMITIQSNLFDIGKQWLKRCKFKILLIHFGQMDDTKVLERSKCNLRIENNLCKKTNKVCALCKIQSINKDNKECTLLNGIIDSAKIFYQGEQSYYNNNETVQNGFLKINLPVHKIYGVKFKIIIDCENTFVLEKVKKLLDGNYFLPSCSDNGNDHRLYLSLPENENIGLFRIEESFNDNFICPLFVYEYKDNSKE